MVGGGVWTAGDVELKAGGGGRPGMDLIGGGRRGRSFTVDGRGKAGGSEELGVVLLVASDFKEPFLKTEAGVGVGGLTPEP